MYEHYRASEMYEHCVASKMYEHYRASEMYVHCVAS